MVIDSGDYVGVEPDRDEVAIINPDAADGVADPAQPAPSAADCTLHVEIWAL
jgi:hypothetical protein